MADGSPAKDDQGLEKTHQASAALDAAAVALHRIWDACDTRTSLHRTDLRREIALTSDEDPSHAIVVRCDGNDDVWLIIDRWARQLDASEPREVLRGRITRDALRWVFRHRLVRPPPEDRRAR